MRGQRGERKRRRGKIEERGEMREIRERERGGKVRGREK